MSVVGIDLGTTNSVVAVMEQGRAEVLPTVDGALLPSVVAFEVTGDILVGAVAQRLATAAPARCITSIKRLMGARHEDVAPWSDDLPYLVEPDDEGLVQIRVGDGTATPPEISAAILRTLRDAAPEPVRAVITVPAYFDDNQRSATALAARLAGIEVLRLLNEPTAAALAYGMSAGSDEVRRVAVYDLGGGTFDVSLLEVGGGVVQVVATGGDTHLGGDDIDLLLVSLLRQRCPVDLQAQGARRLLEAATAAKIELSSADSATVTLPFLAETDGGVVHLESEVTRDTLEQLIEPLVARTVGICRSALYDADWEASDVDEVLLVGGSTRIPAVRSAVAAFFGRAARDGVNPDTAVAVGAAHHAASLTGSDGPLLLDVLPLSLGVEIAGGLTDRILGRNTTLPTSATEYFSTAVANQEELVVHVVQGEREFCADNRSLGRVRLTGIAPARAGVPKIAVTFEVDVDGILHVSARDEASGRVSRAELEGHARVDAATVARMLRDADVHRERDEEARQAVALRRSATVRLRELESDLVVLAGAMGPEDERAVSGAMRAYRQAIDGGTPADIRKAEKSLDACARAAVRKQRGSKP